MALNKQSIIKNFLWKLLERCGFQAVSLVVAIILARILSPSDYGIIAICMIFIAILQIFADNGLGTALIQKKSADDLDFSTVFIANFSLSLFLYIILFFCARLIADFYGIPELTNVLRALGLIIIISSLRNLQHVYVSRNFLFKRLFFAIMIAAIVSAIVGIGMAYSGFGIWALVGQQLSLNAATVVMLWLLVPWRPSTCFSFERFKTLFSFGWKLLLSAIIGSLYEQLTPLIIGKFYSPSDLAYFNQGQKFPQIIISNISSSIDIVLFPVMSKNQDNIAVLREMTRKAIQTSIFIIAPLMMIIAFSAENIVTLVLTDKWLPAVPFVCIFCVNYMFWPVLTANINAINALGRSDIFLKLEILKKISGVAILLFTMQYGIMAMAYGTLLSGLISQIINSWPNNKLLNYGYLQQLRDFLPTVLLAAAAGSVTIWVDICLHETWNLLFVVCMQCAAGIVVYLLAGFIFKLKALQDTYQLLRNMV